MPAAYITTKIQKFVTPDGVTHEIESTRDYKFVVAIKHYGYDDWGMPPSGWFTKLSNAERQAAVELRNGAVEQAVIIRRVSKEYIYREE